MSSQSDTVEKTKIWAVQSIAFAICLRADTTGKTGETASPEFFTLAYKEAEAIALDLWNETIAGTGTNVPGNITLMRVARKVFDWCNSHMDQGK